MSKFYRYAEELNEIAKAAFDMYNKAEAACNKAKAEYEGFARGRNMSDPKNIAKYARLQADYYEAQDALRKAKMEFADTGNRFNSMRVELAAALDEAYGVDPAALDNNTLELLKSGIMNGREYTKLLHEAMNKTNPTMVRMIGKYAADEAKARAEKNGQSDPEAKAMRLVSAESRNYTGGDRLEAFDNMIDLFNRCAKNPRMIDHWERFTAEIVENF